MRSLFSWRCSERLCGGEVAFLFSPVPSGILMNHSELDCVQVRGTVGHVSVMIKCRSAATLVSWTTWHLPAQTSEKCTVLCLFGIFMALVWGTCMKESYWTASSHSSCTYMAQWTICTLSVLSYGLHFAPFATNSQIKNTFFLSFVVCKCHCTIFKRSSFPPHYFNVHFRGN